MNNCSFVKLIIPYYMQLSIENLKKYSPFDLTKEELLIIIQIKMLAFFIIVANHGIQAHGMD